MLKRATYDDIFKGLSMYNVKLGQIAYYPMVQVDPRVEAKVEDMVQR